MKIQKITKIQQTFDRYDLEVANTHNFFANGVLVHNCRAKTTSAGAFRRGGDLYLSAPHIVEELVSFFEEWPDAMLDGEFFNYELRQQLNELGSILGKKTGSSLTPELLARSREIVRFYIYDGYGFGGLTMETPYSVRKAWIDKHVVGKFKYVEPVHTEIFTSQKQFDKFYAEAVEDGQEGIMLRFLKAPYEYSRSKYLLKVKPEDSDEGIFEGVEEGNGNWAGTAKVVFIKWKGQTIRATMKGGKGSHALGVKLLKEWKNWVGKEVTFLYNGLTGLGTPNFARIDINNCIKTDR